MFSNNGSISPIRQMQMNTAVNYCLQPADWQENHATSTMVTVQGNRDLTHSQGGDASERWEPNRAQWKSMEINHTRKTKAIHSEFAAPRQSAAVTQVLADTQRQVVQGETVQWKMRPGAAAGGLTRSRVFLVIGYGCIFLWLVLTGDKHSRSCWLLITT